MFVNSAGAATSASATLTVTSTTSVALRSSIAAPVSGQATNLVAIVSSPLRCRKNIAGSIDFLEAGRLIATAPVAAGRGLARVRFGAGPHRITALYDGSGVVLPAMSAPLDLTVGRAATATIVAGPAARRHGRPARFTATVRTIAPGSGLATGSVTFSDAGTDLATVVLDTVGKAMFSTASLDVGSHSITVSYSGDANHASSSGSHGIVVTP